MNGAASDLFAGFSQAAFAVNGTTIKAVHGGSGPPVLLLHGYPQTHVTWHRIAPRLAESFTVVCPDLRGYGDSAKPPSDQSHEPYSKRVMAHDQLELMRHDRSRPRSCRQGGTPHLSAARPVERGRDRLLLQRARKSGASMRMLWPGARSTAATSSPRSDPRRQPPS
jgi:hypothetical protein